MIQMVYILLKNVPIIFFSTKKTTLLKKTEEKL